MAQAALVEDASCPEGTSTRYVVSLHCPSRVRLPEAAPSLTAVCVPVLFRSHSQLRGSGSCSLVGRGPPNSRRYKRSIAPKPLRTAAPLFFSSTRSQDMHAVSQGTHRTVRHFTPADAQISTSRASVTGFAASGTSRHEASEKRFDGAFTRTCFGCDDLRTAPGADVPLSGNNDYESYPGPDKGRTASFGTTGSLLGVCVCPCCTMLHPTASRTPP